MPAPPAVSGRLLIRGGLVYDHAGDPHRPAARDVAIEGGRILALEEPSRPSQWARETLDQVARGVPGTRTIDARGRLVVPGFVNAHYHSYDVLAKGMFEDLPFDLWALLSQPAYWGRRSQAELRARTLIGAIECLKNGITTVQDMNSLVPQDEETLDTILCAYAEVGIRVVFSAAVRDVAALDIAPFLQDDVPAQVRALVEGRPGNAAADLAFLEAQLQRVAASPTMHWALSPSGPQRCSPELLSGIADLSERYRLPVLTHVYETRAQLAKARASYPEHGGSLIAYLKAMGLLTPRTSLAHTVWLTRPEIEQLALHGTGVVHNPNANLKLKSGIAPVLDLWQAGINIALGCDNCSCGDTQNMFQAMKLFALLAGVSDPMPTGVGAREAIAAATLGGAKAVGLDGQVGAIVPGHRADLATLDLSDIAWQPFNSAARQLVHAESGRGVRTVLVEGRVVLDEGRLTTIDEAAFRTELAGIMERFRSDYDALHARQSPAFPWLLEANRRLWEGGPRMNRFVCRAVDA